MTPIQHAAEAETLLHQVTQAATSTLRPPHLTELLLLRAQAHAHLSRAAGTGDAYEAAEAELENALAAGSLGGHAANHARAALAYAVLADT